MTNIDEAANRSHQVVFPVKWEGQPKILGINPGSVNKDRLPIPPLGILYVAAYARKHGFGQWRIIDNDVIEDNRPVKDFADQMAWADIVALTGTTAQCKQAMEIAAKAKSMGKLVLYGGPHATPAWRETLLRSKVDVVVRGEGEVTFLELLQALESGRNLHEVDGLAFRDANGIPVKTKTRHRNFVLDDIPFPARDLVPTERYGDQPLVRFSTDERYAHLMMTRGCTDKCEFCNTP
ncbi:MAG: cobalamin-dependent protein, partial [Patescibacteria group bacterium]